MGSGGLGQTAAGYMGCLRGLAPVWSHFLPKFQPASSRALSSRPWQRTRGRWCGERCPAQHIAAGLGVKALNLCGDPGISNWKPAQTSPFLPLVLSFIHSLPTAHILPSSHRETHCPVTRVAFQPTAGLAEAPSPDSPASGRLGQSR